MPSGQLRDRLIREALREAPDDYEVQCSQCGDKYEIQECPRVSHGIGLSCASCNGEMRSVSPIPRPTEVK